MQEVLGRKPSTDAVVVDDAGITFSHRSLKRPISVPYEQIASVALVDEGPGMPLAPADDRVPARSPRALGFIDPRLRLPSVVVLLRRPLVIRGIRYGQEKTLRVKGKERRSGVEVEALGFRPVDGRALVDALERRGVHRAPSVLQGQIDLVGEATPARAEELRTQRERGRRRARRFLLLAYASVVPLGSARIELERSDAGQGSVGEWLAINGVALACAAVAFGVVVALPRTQVAGPPSRLDIRTQVKRERRHAFLAIGTCLVLLVVALVANQAGLSASLAFGPLLGLPLGTFGGFTRRSTRLARLTPT